MKAEFYKYGHQWFPLLQSYWHKSQNQEGPKEIFQFNNTFQNSRVNSNFKKVNPYKLSGLREGFFFFSEFILGSLDTV
jgi:hypothetical protein